MYTMAARLLVDIRQDPFTSNHECLPREVISVVTTGLGIPNDSLIRHHQIHTVFDAGVTRPDWTRRVNTSYIIDTSEMR